MSSKSKSQEYEQELLDYIRKDKAKSKRLTLHSSIKYPEDRIEVITRKNKNSSEHEAELFIQRIRPNKSPETISNIYKYNGKESKAFKDIKISSLIKDSKKQYLSNYLDSIRYNNKTPSPTSNSIPELPNDILRSEIANKVTNSNTKRTLKLVSKLFKDIKVSPKYKLNKTLINEVLDYVKEDKTEEQELFLSSTKYPKDSVIISVVPKEKNKELSIWIMKHNESSYNMSKIYKYSGKDINISDLIKMLKKSDQEYMYEYLNSLKNSIVYSYKKNPLLHESFSLLRRLT